MSIRPKTTFFIRGFTFWGLAGFIVAIGCFEPTVTPEQMKASKELASAVMNNWGTIMWKVIGSWALAGGIMGVIISQLFAMRPRHEHYTPMVTPLGDNSGPKTLAEVHAGFQSWILGAIIATCGTIFLLPYFQNELIVVKPGKGEVFLAVIVTFLMTVSILPLSLRALVRQYGREA